MPVEFLTRDQERRYGCYTEAPSEAQLSRYFHLDDADRTLIATHRGEANRLGFALQLATVRFLSTFLPDPTRAPSAVVDFLAAQLRIVDVGCLARYRENEARWDHASEIREHYGYHDFTEPTVVLGLTRWLYSRAHLSTERPSVLFDLATARLVEQKVLLPGVTILARLVARVRDRVASRLWKLLEKAPSAEQCDGLEKLLEVPEGGRQTALDRWRRSPTRISANGLLAALQRIQEIRALGIRKLNLTAIPPSRLQSLARHAAIVRAQSIARMPLQRRIATLVAFAHQWEATAQDEALDLFDQLLEQTLSRVENDGQKARLRSLKDLDAAAQQMRKACLVLLDPACNDPDIRSQVFANVPQANLSEAVKRVDELTRPEEDHYYDLLWDRYNSVRRFLPTMLEALNFQDTPAGRSVVIAWNYLREVEIGKQATLKDAPMDVVTTAWRHVVVRKDGKVDRRYYTFCVLERLREALRRREIFVTPSEHWGDPHAKFLSGAAWEAARSNVCRTLGRSADANVEMENLRQQLDEAYRRTSLRLPGNTAVRLFTNAKGRDTLSLAALDKLEEPPELIVLRQKVMELLPQVELPEVLLEVQAWTGFADEFTHISENNARVENLSLSVCATLLAEACNIGLAPLIRRDSAALTRARLSWVQQNYLRAETLVRANARLVDAQADIPLAQTWGGGEVASADGLRFVVPVRTLHAGPNSKYFHVGRGVTYYNYTSDQFSGFHAIVIPGTIRDALYILEGLLEQQTSLRPKELMTDTAGYSDLVFGLFWLLGYQFSPRLADIGRTRFWRIEKGADYGALNNLARHHIKTDLIARHWDDLLRVAGSLQMGAIRASELVRTLQSGNKITALGRALAELGRFAKTLYLLAYLDDEDYRRRILVQLNRGEGRNGMARVTFHGKRGELRQRYREGQEDQLGSLGLVVNALTLWNTRYMEAALTHLRTSGMQIDRAHIQRLSPLIHEHINLLGRYYFVLDEMLRLGALRPLRNPYAPDEQY